MSGCAPVKRRHRLFLLPSSHMDYSDLKGGLVRMLDRLRSEGTATKDIEADEFLRADPNAALIGLLYDQRVLAETAFTGPYKLRQRLGHFDMRRIADMDADAFKAVFTESPAVHRFVNVMADRTQDSARLLCERYDGNAAGIWTGDVTWPDVRARLLEFPGYGPMKARKMRLVLHYFGHRTFPDPGS